MAIDEKNYKERDEFHFIGLKNLDKFVFHSNHDRHALISEKYNIPNGLYDVQANGFYFKNGFPTDNEKKPTIIIKSPYLFSEYNPNLNVSLSEFGRLSRQAQDNFYYSLNILKNYVNPKTMVKIENFDNNSLQSRKVDVGTLEDLLKGNGS
mgnify:CR=1 FL=1